MLHIVAFLNNTAIGRVDIHNTLLTNRKGQYKYTVAKGGEPVVGYVWHKREDGWMRLAQKAIGKYLKRKGDG